MRRSLWRGYVVRVLLVVSLVVMINGVYTATPAHAAKLERLADPLVEDLEARDRRLREALAFDQDFAVAGFVEVRATPRP